MMTEFPPWNTRVVQPQPLLLLLTYSPKKRRVPDWFYDETVCGLTIASFMWFANIVCVVFHLGLAFVTVLAATQNGSGMDTPKLTVYLTKLTWQANSTDALIPTNVPQDGLLLAHMTVWFFLLSALAHGLIVACNYEQAMGSLDPSRRVITRFTGWYYSWIHECRQPLRWIECASLRFRIRSCSPSPTPIAVRTQTRKRRSPRA